MRPEGIELELPFLTSSVYRFPFYVPQGELVMGSVYEAEKESWCLPFDHLQQNNNNNNEESKTTTTKRGKQTKTTNNKEDETTKKNRNYYQIGEEVTVRILNCIVRGKDSEMTSDDHHPPHGPAMELVGSFLGEGLGPTAWYAE
ncbi:RNA polymerase III subunit Rpc25, putative [Angomonas deanei]|uniref:RNA polymerase III subunit Rpc25, putative n=1 Tax=Angomonas deanei TaxID=59799 RepID=A0A7G2CQH8_9TRYP|nr:RNA polymerase III subunit Rpc25, putative [Angomonas deanei]